MTAPTKQEIEALIASLEGEAEPPRWYLQPSTESEFAASVVVRTGATPTYDEDDHLTGIRGSVCSEARSLTLGTV
jgi:hypothetical protein